MKHFKSADFIFNLIGLFSSLFIIAFAVQRRSNAAYIGVGIVLLVLGVNNFIIYFKKHEKQCKEESASAKLKFKGE